MSSQHLATKGSTAFSVGDFNGAIEQFTQALLINQDYDVLVQKSRALTEINSLEAAIADAAIAITLNATRPEAYLAKGIALFKNSQIRAGQQDLAASLANSSTNKSLEIIIKRWQKKCDTELSGRSLQNQKTSSLSVVTPAVSPLIPQTAAAPASSVVSSVTGKIAYTWYQTSKSVGIEINHSLTNKESLKTNFEANRIEVTFPIGNGSDYDLSLDLFADIVPENTKVVVQLSKIEIILEKKISDVSWKSLNAEEKKLTEKIQVEEEEIQTEKTVKKDTGNNTTAAAQKILPNANAVPAYPSSSLKKKNWDKIDMEIAEDMKTNKGDYCISDDPMKGIFKQIYDASDEDTKRAMMKSYLTSGGTVLSTNWSEVKEKDYEGKDKPEAPQGQEWRKWEK